MKLNKKVLGMAVAVALVSTSASAVSLFGNNTQRGSLLIFPRIDVSKDTDTLITMISDYQSDSVRVKCYYVAPAGKYNEGKLVQDFEFTLTHNNPVYWWARRGGNGASPFSPFPDPKGGGTRAAEKGELKCWAVDAFDGTEIHFNHLVGTASVFNDNGQASEYTAWAFQAVEGGATTANTFKKLSSPGVLNLDNAEYDACPSQLLGSYLPGNGLNGTAETQLEGLHVHKTRINIASCAQDLRQDRGPIFTKLNYTFWNEHEESRTGYYECMDSWYEADLDKFGPGTYEGIGRTKIAYFRVYAAPSTVCGPLSAQVNPGIVGVKTEWDYGRINPSTNELDVSTGPIVTRGTNLSGRGEKTTNVIVWDPPRGDSNPNPPPNN